MARPGKIFSWRVWQVGKSFGQHDHAIVSLFFKYCDSQKHESSCLLNDRFLCISSEPLELRRKFLRLFASLSEELSDEKRIF